MVDYSVTQYNPYNMYQNYGYYYPSFNGAYTQQYQNIPLYDFSQMNYNYQPDVVSFSANNPIQNETKKQGLSNGAKWGIGTVAVLGLGALAYVLSRGKVGSASVKQLAEHMDFKKAGTIEEAKKFALEKLGVKLNLNDLEVANYVNEGLVNVSNKLKGKTVMPKVVELDSSSEPISHGFMAWRREGSKLILKHQIENLAENARKKGVLLDEYIRTAMYKDSRFADKGLSPFHYVHHELGHGNHFANCSESAKMVSLKKLADRGITDTHYTEEFLKEINTPELQDLFKNTFLSDYGKTAPTEFVAEVFANIVDGAKVPKEFMTLYEKYGGMPIPA